MAFVKYTGSNLAIGQLLGGISNSSGTLILATGQGGLFPSAFPFKLKIEQFDAQSRVIKREIVKCTNRVGDTFTITRSHEACPADYSAVTQTTTAFAFNSGDTVSLAITADAIDDIQDELETKVAKAGDTMTGALKLAQGATIASATTTDLSAATGNALTISGTTTINSFGTVTAGAEYTLTFSGILTLTYNVTSMILPTSANITTAVGDVAKFLSLGSGNWKCVSYERLNGSPLSSPVIGATKTTFVAGENLTAGQPVYVSDGTGARTAGRVYRADALDATYTDSYRFIGFAAETITSGNNIIIDTEGINLNQTGLTIGAEYYLSDSVGTISTSKGTNSINVGKAISTTGILINTTSNFANELRKTVIIPAGEMHITTAGAINVNIGITLQDGSTSAVQFYAKVPENVTNISSILLDIVCGNATGNVMIAVNNIYRIRSGVAATFDSDAARAYAVTGGASLPGAQISINNAAFNGLGTLQKDDYIVINLGREGGNVSDTFNGASIFLVGAVIIFS